MGSWLGGIAAVLLISVSLAQNGLAQGPTQLSPSDTLVERVVDRYLDAYNRHDVRALHALLADTVFLGRIPAQSSDELLSADTLAARLASAFRHYPDLNARRLKRVLEGPFVVDRYQITIGKKIEFELFAYDVRGGRIVRMWEFRPGKTVRPAN
jgi:hypothetical protein